MAASEWRSHEWWRSRADLFQALALMKKGREQRDAIGVARDCLRIAERQEAREAAKPKPLTRQS